VSHIGALILLGIVGRLETLGGWYVAGLLSAAVLAAWQQILIRDRDPRRCFRAFLNNNAFGMVISVGVLLDYALVPS